MRNEETAESGVLRRQFLGGIGSVAVLGLAGCAGTQSTPETDEPTTGAGGTAVSATLEDYAIDLSQTTMPAGTVTFEIENAAEQEHEFVVFDTDLAEDNLPTTDDGNEVDESAESLTVVDEVEDIEGGESATLTVDLPSGNYVAICNISGHYALGMYAGFTVE